MTTTFDPRRYLAMQLDFLHHSCQIFDEGGNSRYEAIRIAAVLRTLFRDAWRGKNQVTKSVFTHVADKGFGVPTLLSTAPEIAPDAIMSVGGLSAVFIVSGSAKGRHVPYLENGPYTYRWVDRETWWTETIYVVGDEPKRLSRKDIVLAAAEQDGGVHVDEELDASYLLVKAGVWQLQAADGRLADIAEAHLADLRQMAYEVLNSPCMKELVKPK